MNDSDSVKQEMLKELEKSNQAAVSNKDENTLDQIKQMHFRLKSAILADPENALKAHSGIHKKD